MPVADRNFLFCYFRMFGGIWKKMARHQDDKTRLCTTFLSRLSWIVDNLFKFYHDHFF